MELVAPGHFGLFYLSWYKALEGNTCYSVSPNCSSLKSLGNACQGQRPNSGHFSMAKAKQKWKVIC